jgi:hypothetical protein
MTISQSYPHEYSFFDELGKWIRQLFHGALNIYSTKSKQNIASTQVKKLVDELYLLQGVDRVTPSSNDLHEFQFELQFSPSIEVTNEVWEQIQDLVIKSEWDLRDRTNESWYFQAEMVLAFDELSHNTKSYC